MPSGWCGLCRGPALGPSDRKAERLGDQAAAEPEVVLPALGPAHEHAWRALGELVQRIRPDRWVVAGGQAVLLHAAEHNRQPPRVTTDADVVVDVRTQPRATSGAARTLKAIGFTCQVGPHGEGHRFVRGYAQIDVLAPEGLGPRADLTTDPGAKTMETPGGSQALRRAEFVRVRVGGAGPVVRLRRVSLLGAIVGKAYAVSLPGSPGKHRADAWFLLSLLKDPYDAARDTTTADRQALRVLAEGPGPAGMDPNQADDARAALAILLGGP